MKSVELHTESISKNWLFPVNNSHFRTSNPETQVEKISDCNTETPHFHSSGRSASSSRKSMMLQDDHYSQKDHSAI